MKKFKLTHYEGSIDKIGTVIDTKVIEAESIDKVKISSILPDDILKDSYYVRGLIWDEKNHSLDYGSYSRFIWVEEIE